MSELREKLSKIILDGRQAEIALEKLGTLEKAEAEDATIDDLRQAVAIAESEGDFQTASRLKDKWIGLLRGGAQ